MYLAPSISATYRLVTPRERALATALLFLVLNFIGIGIGPILTGFISHTIGNNLLDSGVPGGAGERRRPALRAFDHRVHVRVVDVPLLPRDAHAASGRSCRPERTDRVARA